MKKLTHLARVSLLLAVFFALDKALAILRQLLIARQFGLSAELDAFNTANNLPDLLFALISGGALAIAFIPVLSGTLSTRGRPAAWELFSRVANLALIVTGVLALVTALLAGPLVRGQLGIAPGFAPEQQALVAELMRLNLVATLLFSLSGLVMAGLQANQHFFLPALAPLFYNLGQIFGALVLSPSQGYSFGPLRLPAFGLGIHGLVYGVILGAGLHLLVQVPGLVRYRFRWSPSLGLRTPDVRLVLGLLGPRLLTMLFIQYIFIARDNLASRLSTGAVSALTYAWMIMQVPETLIGTAIGTALLPTLSEQAARGEMLSFRQTVERALQVLLAITLPVALLLSLAIKPLIGLAFHFDAAGTEMVAWAARAFLFGIIPHSVLEVLVRAFYAQKDARVPLLASGLTALLFTLFAGLLFGPLGAAGIALANTLAYGVEAVVLLAWLQRRLGQPLALGGTLLRTAGGTAAAGLLAALLGWALPLGELPLALAVLALGGAAALPFIWKEMRVLFAL